MMEITVLNDNIPSDRAKFTSATGYTVRVEAWSGQVRPYVATVWTGSIRIGRTGYCSTFSGAVDSAHKLIAKHSTK